MSSHYLRFSAGKQVYKKWDGERGGVSPAAYSRLRISCLFEIFGFAGFIICFAVNPVKASDALSKQVMVIHTVPFSICMLATMAHDLRNLWHESVSGYNERLELPPIFNKNIDMGYAFLLVLFTISMSAPRALPSSIIIPTLLIYPLDTSLTGMCACCYIAFAVKVCLQMIGLYNMPWIPPSWYRNGFAPVVDKIHLLLALVLPYAKLIFLVFKRPDKLEVVEVKISRTKAAIEEDFNCEKD